MYELKKNGKVFMSKFVGTGPSSYEKRIYRATVSQKLRNTELDEADTDPSRSNSWWMMMMMMMMMMNDHFIFPYFTESNDCAICQQ